MSHFEEQSLHLAALHYARTRFQTLEVRQRVGLAREVSGLLVERDPTTDREFFQRDELEPALELARLTLLHAGEKDVWSGPDDRRPSATERLLLEIREAVRRAQRCFAPSGESGKTLGAAVLAFNEIVGLVGTCSRMAGDPPCARDGQCPEHGRDREGQCVPTGGEQQAARSKEQAPEAEEDRRLCPNCRAPMGSLVESTGSPHPSTKRLRWVCSARCGSTTGSDRSGERP